MKLKHISPNRVAVQIIPWLHSVLILAPLYALLAGYIYKNPGCDYYFFVAFLGILPVAGLSLATKYCRFLWQYLLVAVALLAGTFFLTKDFIAFGIVAILVFLRLLGRVQHTKTLLDAPHPLGVIPFLLAFVVSGALNEPFVQKATLITAAIYLALTFIYRGLTRLQNYMEMNETLANFPHKRIEKSSGIALALTAFAALAVVIPLILLCFTFVPINLTPPPRISRQNIPAPEIPLSNSVTEKPPWMAALDEAEKPLFDLSFLGNILMVLAAISGIGALFLGIYRLTQNFRKSVLEKNDLIESTQNFETDSSFRQRKGKLRILDFSFNAAVRRKYVKAVRHTKKSAPQPWQSPKEIEESAGISDAALHTLYEKARYSQEGCTKKDV